MRAIILPVFFVLTALVFAPKISTSQITYGLKAGVGLSNYGVSNNLKEVYTVDSRFVFHGGAMASYRFGGKFGVRAELLYAMKGSKYTNRETVQVMDNQGNTHTGQFKFEEKLNYIDVPVLFQYRFRGRTVSPYVTLGPEFSFAMGGKFFSRFDSPTFVQENDPVDLTFGSANADTYKGFNFGLSFGGGAEIDLDGGALIIDLRYGLGLTNMVSSGLSSQKISNRLVSLSFGYMFSGGGW